MNTNEATANGSLTELRQSQLAAERIRQIEPAAPRGGGLQLVPDEGGDFLKGLFANPAPDPVADTARGGNRLDPQGRLTCKKLLASLGWSPGQQLTVHRLSHAPVLLIRSTVEHGIDVDGSACDCGTCVQQTVEAAALDDDWDELLPDVEVTPKSELRLSQGLCHSIGIEMPGEVLAVAAPAAGGLLLTSTAHAMTCLLGGRPLTPLPTPDPSARSTTAPTNARP